MSNSRHPPYNNVTNHSVSSLSLQVQDMELNSLGQLSPAKSMSAPPPSYTKLERLRYDRNNDNGAAPEQLGVSHGSGSAATALGVEEEEAIPEAEQEEDVVIQEVHEEVPRPEEDKEVPVTEEQEDDKRRLRI